MRISLVTGAVFAVLATSTVRAQARPNGNTFYVMDLSQDVVPLEVAIEQGRMDVIRQDGKRYLRPDPTLQMVKFIILLPEPLPAQYTIEYEMLLPSDWAVRLEMTPLREYERAEPAATCGAGFAGFVTMDGANLSEWMDLPEERLIRCRLAVNGSRSEQYVNGKATPVLDRSFGRGQMLLVTIPVWEGKTELFGEFRITTNDQAALARVAARGAASAAAAQRALRPGDTRYPRGNLALDPVPGKCMGTSRHDGFVRMADGTVRYIPSDKVRSADLVTALKESLQTPVPGLDNVVAIEQYGEAFLIADGTVRRWGGNDWHLVPGIGDAVAVAGPLMLLADGTVRKLTNTRARLAVPIEGLAEVRAIASGMAELALMRDNTVRTWGHWLYTEIAIQGTGGDELKTLGIGREEDVKSPTPVTRVANAVGIVTGAGGASAAILTDGTVKSWGLNQGLKQDDTGKYHSTIPTTIPALRSPIAMTTHLALFADGSVADWYNPRQGITKYTTITDAVAIASSAAMDPLHMALRANGDLFLWGGPLRKPTLAGNVGAETAAQCALRK